MELFTLASLAEVEIGRDRAFVANALHWVLATSVAFDILMNDDILLLLLLLLLFLILLFNLWVFIEVFHHLHDLRQQTFDFLKQFRFIFLLALDNFRLVLLVFLKDQCLALLIFLVRLSLNHLVG